MVLSRVDSGSSSLLSEFSNLVPLWDLVSPTKNKREIFLSIGQVDILL